MHVGSNARPGGAHSAAAGGGGKLQCANCGGHGHLYRNCGHPVSSFGVVCCRIAQQPDGRCRPEYLMVQRKDSLSFVEFIRGKYNVQNRGYIMRLLSNMTTEERARLQTTEFDELWRLFWQSDHDRSFMKEYEQSKARFCMLREGYMLRSPVPPDDGELRFFSLDTALRDTTSPYDETEFGFPKGRRNINETDMRCACREFSEETGVRGAEICFVQGLRPFEEVFTGSNNTRYRHVYFVALLRPGARAWADPLGEMQPARDTMQMREVRATAWYDAEGVLSHIRDENVERKLLFRKVHEAIVASIVPRPGVQNQSGDEGQQAPAQTQTQTQTQA